MTTTAQAKMMAARTALVLDQPFFGALALRLALKEDATCKTAWTDGRSMGYNPAFVESLTHDELLGLVAHEVMHCASGHPWRRDARDHKRWNIAADYAINSELVEAKFTLPEGGLLDPQFNGKSAEWVFDRLPESPPSGGKDGDEDGEGGEGEGEGEGEGQPGEVRDAPAEAAADAATEADWKQAVQQAALAAQVRGNLPAAMGRFAKQAALSSVDWRAALRRFVQQTAKADYTWSMPSRRYVARGLYLPSMRSEEVGPMVVAVDTSGSIDDVLLAQFASEIQAIADEVKPERIEVIYCDAQVNRRETFERGDVIKLEAAGGGGTDFRPVFDAVAAMDDAPVCVVYLTDLAGSFPTEAPAVPTLWASTTRSEAPFGETLYCGA